MSKQAHALKYLTIKPTSICEYNCPYCTSRQDLFDKIATRQLAVSEWEAVLKSARNLGLVSIRISGGEPTLYKDLPRLVSIAKQNSSLVQMYSNGRRLSTSLANELEAAGLQDVSISMLSLQSVKHDHLRRTAGSHQWAVNACEVLAKSSMCLSLHVIVCRHNYCEIPDIIQYSHNLGADALELHYPENDIDNHYLLMTSKDITRWRDEVLHKCISRLDELNIASVENIEVLERLYAQHSENADHSEGVYWPSANAAGGCTKPTSFAMIYPSGDVLPCNAIEYTHEPIVGNVCMHPLDEIWHNEKFERFRRERTTWCKYCPMMLHSRLQLS